MAGSLPPSSRVSFLSVPDADAMMALPVRSEPVKEMWATSGCSTIHRPSWSPPVTMFTTPAGKLFWATDASITVDNGV